MGLQGFTVHDVDAAGEKSGNIIFQTHIGVNILHGIRFDIDHDVDIAVGPIVAARDRAEQSGVGYAARPQGGLVFPERGKDFLTVHSECIA